MELRKTKQNHAAAAGSASDPRLVRAIRSAAENDAGRIHFARADQIRKGSPENGTFYGVRPEVEEVHL